MKKLFWVLDKKNFAVSKPLLLTLLWWLLLSSGCTTTETFLDLDSTFTTNDQGTATIEGTTNDDSELTIAGETIPVKDGKFSHKISLSSDQDFETILTISAKRKEATVEQKITVKASDNFIEQTEREKAETVLALAEKESTQKNYDEAASLVASLSRTYEDLEERLTVVKDHLAIEEAVKTAEKEQTRESYEQAVAAVEKATLNTKNFSKRLRAVDESISAQETLAKQTQAAKEALEKAEQSLAEEDHSKAAELIQALPEKNTDWQNRLDQVKQKISAEKQAAEQRKQAEEQQKQAEQAAAAAEAQRAAEEQATAQQANQQTVMITPTGSKYHTHKCGNGTYSETTLDHALSLGLSPCSKCFG